MMFQCSQGHKFHYPSKYIVNQYSRPTTDIQPVILSSIETSVCPVCKDDDFTEFVEVVEVESVKSVEINEADTWIKQGYQPKDYFAKTVTLIKLKSAPNDAKPTEQPDQDSAEAAEDNSPENTREWKNKIDCTQAIANGTFTETPEAQMNKAVDQVAQRLAEVAYKKLEGKQP